MVESVVCLQADAQLNLLHDAETLRHRGVPVVHARTPEYNLGGGSNRPYGSERKHTGVEVARERTFVLRQNRGSRDHCPRR